MAGILLLVIAFLSLIGLMIIHEFGHFIIAKKFGVRVDEFGIGYPPRLFGKKIGETIYSVNLLPLGAFVRIYGEEGGIDDCRSFTNLKIWKRVLIIIGGVAAFWLAAIVIFSVVFGLGASVPVSDEDVQGLVNARVSIMQVVADSPAGSAGLQSGDVVVELSGDLNSDAQAEVLSIDKISQFKEFTQKYAGEQIYITVNRGGNIITLPLTPRVSFEADQGAVGVGLERLADVVEKYAWYKAPIQGAVYTWKVTVGALAGFYSMIADLVVGKGVPAGAEFAGPLGITVFLANAASYGAGFYLYFIGVIAVLIAIFNLFPIPALDGGKLIFLLIEKIRKKPVSARVEQRVTVIFFTLLIVLSLFITIRFDVPRFTDFLKSVL